MNTADYMAYTANNDLPASKFSVLSNLNSLLYGLYILSFLPQCLLAFWFPELP